MKRQNNGRLSDAFVAVGVIGLNMVATIAVGLLLGRECDSYLGTHPWATVIGIVLGMLAGLWSAFKRIMRQ